MKKEDTVKKQVLALLLAFVLCLGCPVGALAADTPEPVGEPAPIAAAPEEEIPEFDVWCDKLSAELRAEILTDEPPLWSEYGYDSRQSLLADWGMTEDDYNEMLLWVYYDSLYYDDYDWTWDEAEWVAETREQMGAPGTGLAVMLNGSFISFPDAQPEITDGRTMTPLRALADAMGAQTQYDAAARRITVTLGESTLCFTVGKPELTVTADGQTRTVSLDCAPYMKNGRTYVPVRFLAEAAGCTVQWDAAFNTVVLIDRDVLISSIDQNFTVLNRLLPGAAESTQTWRTVSSLAMLFDLDTLPSLRLQLASEVTQNLHGSHAKLTADLSGLLERLLPEFGVTPEPELLAALSDAEAEIIINQDDGKLYLHCPAVMQFLSETLPVSADDWIELPVDWADMLSGSSTQQLLELLRGGTSVGTLLYLSQLGAGLYDYPVMAYSSITDAAQRLTALCGDSRFALVGGEYVLRFDRDAYEQMVYGELPESDDLYDYSRFDVLVRIGEHNGMPTLNAEFRISTDGRDSTSGTISSTGTQAYCSILSVVDGVSRISVEAKANTEPVETAPLAAPPAGSHVVTQDMLLMPIAES